MIVRPGEWLIDGYHVVRYGYRQWHKNCVIWCIYAPGATIRAQGGDEPVHATQTLAQARKWIQEQ